QRLVQIRPRDGNEVLDAARNRTPVVVDHAKRGVAVLHRVGENAQRHQIVNLIDGDLLPAQLHEDGVGTLDAAPDARRNAFAPQLGLQGLADFVEEFLVGMSLALDGGDDFAIGVRLQVLEREVLELTAHLAHSKAVGDGRIDFEGLAGNALAAFRSQVAERAHVVNAVGQLYHDDAYILD